MGVLSQEGRRVICFCLPLGPTRAVLRAYASVDSRGGSLPETKSLKDGPVLSLSAKVVGRTRGFVVGVSGSRAVAKERVDEGAVRKTRKGEVQGWPWRQRDFGRAAAMVRL